MSQNSPRLPVRGAILERRTYEPAAEARAGKIRLDFNENTTGCSPAVLRALRKLSPKQLAMYSEYQQSTKRLAKYFGVQAEQVLLANGGDDALRVFFDTFVDAGSSVLICDPTFPMYRYYAEIFGAELIALKYSSEMDFPVEEVSAALARKPRVLFVANPNNPTGTLVQLDSLRRIVEAATETAVVIDEAYAEFSGVTVIPWIREYPHLFSVRTFSKAAGLAGLRLGAVIGQRDSVGMLRRAMPPFPVNTAALVAAEAAVRDRTAIRRYVRKVAVIRLWLAKELVRRGVRVFPSAGNFLLADLGSAGGEQIQLLEKRGILVRHRKDIGPGFARITIGTREEMHTLLRALDKLRKHRG
jgi:histidinol-phosphate aminotransferase